jgi:sulfonate transport system ATP-binding protein
MASLLQPRLTLPRFGGAARALQRSVLTRHDPAPAAGLAIGLSGVAKGFGERRVLQALDLHAAPGEFVVLIGRSGCGKSTILKLLAGLEAPDSGTITLGGAPPAPGAPAVRIMFQDGRLLPWRTVLQNVALGLPRADLARARQALDSVGLADRADEWPRVLSGGQKQRVALARALVVEPRLILLDEPLGALDALTRLDMQRLIETIWQRAGFTAVLVTHDVAEAALLADRILLIEGGQVAMDVRVDLPRPREPGAALAEIEAQVLGRLLRQ